MKTLQHVILWLALFGVAGYSQSTNTVETTVAQPAPATVRQFTFPAAGPIVTYINNTLLPKLDLSAQRWNGKLGCDDQLPVTPLPMSRKNSVSWKEYVDLADRLNEERISGLRREMEIEFKAKDSAIQKVETATEKRFESVNEFRQALASQTNTFMPRAEVESRISTNTIKNEELADRLNRMDGRGTGINQSWGFFATSAGLILVALALYFHPH